LSGSPGWGGAEAARTIRRDHGSLRYWGKNGKKRDVKGKRAMAVPIEIHSRGVLKRRIRGRRSAKSGGYVVNHKVSIGKL